MYSLIVPEELRPVRVASAEPSFITVPTGAFSANLILFSVLVVLPQSSICPSI